MPWQLDDDLYSIGLSVTIGASMVGLFFLVIDAAGVRGIFNGPLIFGIIIGCWVTLYSLSRRRSQSHEPMQDCSSRRKRWGPVDR